ncbi:hypothetical protein BH11ACT2_BH11ACT2_20890 [soil metagenome]
MSTFLALLAAVGPTPTPTSTLSSDDLVTPTWVGFTAIFLVGVVVIFLVIDMVRRLRRLNYRAEIRERLENEAAAEEQARNERPIPHDD